MVKMMRVLVMHSPVYDGPATVLRVGQGMGVRRLVRGDGSRGLRLVEVV